MVLCGWLSLRSREHLIPESVTSASKSFKEEKGLVVKAEVQVSFLIIPNSSFILINVLS